MSFLDIAKRRYTKEDFHPRERFVSQNSSVQHNCFVSKASHDDLVRVSIYSVAQGMLSTFGNLPREDSEAEEDLLTLNTRSESLSSGLLL